MEAKGVFKCLNPPPPYPLPHACMPDLSYDPIPPPPPKKKGGGIQH